MRRSVYVKVCALMHACSHESVCVCVREKKEVEGSGEGAFDVKIVVKY